MSAFAKDFLRTVARKPGRFLALLAIVALGAGFYAGLRMTAPDMDLSVDRYLDATRTYDVRVVSTMGLDGEDVEALAALPAVESAMGAYEADVLALFGDAPYTMRIHSLPASAAESSCDDGLTVASDDGSYLNRLILAEGDWPRSAGECVLSADRVVGMGVSVGDEVELTRGTSDLDDVLSVRKLKVVGKAHMPYYVSSASIDASQLGSGVVQQVAYVAEGTFADSYPITEAFLTVEGARGLAYTTQAYDDAVAEAVGQVESIAEERCAARLETLTENVYGGMTTYEGMLDLVEYRLSHTQVEIDDPEPPEWLVMDRSKNAGTASFTADAGRVDRIASVFPFIFFLVAALVALTTMTRMVDEERQLIGTYKALGYSRARITGKYVGYALCAALVGSAIGIAVLSQVLPGVIMLAYSIIYYVPGSVTPIDWPLAALSAGIAVGAVLVATGASAAATLREAPASLMLPRAPAAGKRILLERVGPVWARLSFTWKVTFRNLFRYRKRFVMTVVGIAGCTALLLTGLGLRDSINDIIDVQYGEIVHHNVVVSLEDRAADAELAGAEAAMAATGAVLDSAEAYSETMLASGPRARDKRIDVVVPMDADAFARMKTLRTRQGHEPLAIAEGEALLNEKLAQELGLAVGDVIEVSPQDAMGNALPETHEVRVGGLYENYLYNYLYLMPSGYEEAFGKEAPVNTVYVDAAADAALRAGLDEALKEQPAVKTVAYNDETISTYKSMLRSVDLIVVVLVLSAAALAFIVLYNLTNINIEERIREIATLKVLGFTKRETNAYIFREIALLTVVGALLGLVLGVGLEGFVVTSAEVDQVMFGRTVHPPSFAWAFVLTLAFSASAMLMMLPKLSRVDMVESLKSNE